METRDKKTSQRGSIQNMGQMNQIWDNLVFYGTLVTLILGRVSALFGQREWGKAHLPLWYWEVLCPYFK